MAIRGIRGATTIEKNTKEEIIENTKELLIQLVEKNNIMVEDIASAFFSMTDDIDAEFPAVAARKIGWSYTPLFCQKELAVPGSLGKCIRVLIHLNCEKPQNEMIHLYLRGSEVLRPDVARLKNDN